MCLSLSSWEMFWSYPLDSLNCHNRHRQHRPLVEDCYRSSSSYWYFDLSHFWPLMTCWPYQNHDWSQSMCHRYLLLCSIEKKKKAAEKKSNNRIWRVIRINEYLDLYWISFVWTSYSTKTQNILCYANRATCCSRVWVHPNRLVQMCTQCFHWQRSTGLYCWSVGFGCAAWHVWTVRVVVDSTRRPYSS